MIKLGNSWVNPDKILSIRVPNMVNADSFHRVEVVFEGLNYPLTLKSDMEKIDAEQLCDAYAAAIDNSLQSYGNTDDNAAHTQEE